MTYVLALVDLLLVVAVIVLFAMLGELYTRTGMAASRTGRLAEAQVGRRPDAWPAELAPLSTARDAVLMVLSTSCASCNKVAGELAGQLDVLPGYETGVALSTVGADRAESFMREYGLPRRSVYVDIGGDWVTGAFGVQTSPSALILRDGELVSAVVFGDIAALRSTVDRAKTQATANSMVKEAR